MANQQNANKISKEEVKTRINEADLAYQKLTDEQKKVTETKQITGTFSINEWLEFMSGLINFDEKANKFIDNFPKSPNNGCITWVILLFVGIFISVFSGIFWLGVVPLIIYLLYKYSKPETQPLQKFRQLDLPDYFRKTVFPFLQFIQEDIAPDTSITLWLNLRTPLNKNWKKCLTHRV